MNEKQPITAREQAELKLTQLMIEQRNPIADQDIKSIAKHAKTLADFIFRNRKNQEHSDS